MTELQLLTEIIRVNVPPTRHELTVVVSVCCLFVFVFVCLLFVVLKDFPITIQTFNKQPRSTNCNEERPKDSLRGSIIAPKNNNMLCMYTS